MYALIPPLCFAISRNALKCSPLLAVYTLAHELYPGKFRPTITHSFIRLLAEKGLLHTCFTQNIDTLERRAGVPEEKIIEAHGSFATQRCIDCSETFDDDAMKRHILDKKIAKCVSCGGYVKPDIVFFGEAVGISSFASVIILKGSSSSPKTSSGRSQTCARPTC